MRGGQEKEGCGKEKAGPCEGGTDAEEIAGPARLLCAQHGFNSDIGKLHGGQ